jgi:hypothetical protein
MKSAVARIWIKIWSWDFAKFEKDGHCRCHCLCPRFEWHKFIFIHQQSSGKFSPHSTSSSPDESSECSATVQSWPYSNTVRRHKIGPWSCPPGISPPQTSLKNLPRGICRDMKCNLMFIVDVWVFKYQWQLASRRVKPQTYFMPFVVSRWTRALVLLSRCLLHMLNWYPEVIPRYREEWIVLWQRQQD